LLPDCSDFRDTLIYLTDLVEEMDIFGPERDECASKHCFPDPAVLEILVVIVATPIKGLFCPVIYAGDPECTAVETKSG
jgi:hypothetical protein